MSRLHDFSRRCWARKLAELLDLVALGVDGETAARALDLTVSPGS